MQDDSGALCRTDGLAAELNRLLEELPDRARLLLLLLFLHGQRLGLAPTFHALLRSHGHADGQHQ